MTGGRLVVRLVGFYLANSVTHLFSKVIRTLRSGHKLNFFCLLFVKKISICLESKYMTPRRGHTILFRSFQGAVDMTQNLVVVKVDGHSGR